MTYKTKARKLVESGFWLAGFGHFDLSINEVAKVLELVEEENFVSLKAMYKYLAKERMGDE